MPQQRDELIDRTIAALLWVAAFAFATGLFLSTTLLLRVLPPTPLVAVGRVTVERASKLRDYTGAALFFILIAPLTIALYRAGARQNERLRRRARNRNAVSLLFVAPFFLAPFLFLTTEKWGWPIVLPVALAVALPRIVLLVEQTAWLRNLLRRDLRPFHLLIATEAASWIVFRYIATGKRIAHVPTLFLEIAFVVFIVAIFWSAFVLIARIATMCFGTETDAVLQRIAVAALPLIMLPLLGVLLVRGSVAISAVMAIVAISCGGQATSPVRDSRSRPSSIGIRHATLYLAIPLLLYCASYVSAAATWQSIDLFHRGESLGPASDYVRGKVPYRDVFVLHGLLDDGLLDGWIMELFGREESIVLARPAIMGSLAAPALWYLACALFDSAPLAVLVVVLGAVTFVDNDRALFEIIAVALFLAAVKRRSNALFVACGAAAGLALFYSLDIGLYSIVGAIAAALLLRNFRAVVPLVAGIAIGAAPFVIYLAIRGALGAFFVTSFGTVPAIIDPVWSLPFPDLTATFRNNLNLHTIADFLLNERFRFVLNPLILGIAIVVIVCRALSRRRDWPDVALITVVTFAVLTQRSALGRADFRHQYFSAFLVAPVLVMLLVLVWRAPRALAIAATVALLPVFVIALWVPDIVNSRLDDMTHYAARVRQAEYVDPQAAEIRHRINDVRFEIAQLTRPGEPIFDFSNQPALYFFCDRPNPTRFYQVPILSPRAFQREVIVALDRAKPKAIIRRSPQEFDEFDGIDNSVRAQAVASYIDDHYSYAATRYGVEVWKRKPEAIAVDLAVYLRKIHVPTVRELGSLGNRGRVVFPWMASEGGGAGTRWQSDLTLHNPLAVPMRLRLRYIAGDTRVDHDIALAPQRSMQLNDVVNTFFHAPETGGVVWIEYRGDRAPVARAQTYDAAHDRGGSIAEPLSLDDSAAAGTPRDQLSILGFSTRHNLINLGVVNVGESPMIMRMTVVAANGVRIGKTIEQSVDEDQAFVISDAEKELGLRLDPTMTAHVAVLGGRAVAFATTIEANGDTEFLAGVPSSQK